ncbi:hypothetical protein [Dyadobacter frigoris]|nr:hypothetical protein [Dyadobacter frigoris]
MTDMVAAEFIPWKINPKHPIINAVGMADFVTAEFIPWKFKTYDYKMP